jgi:hypothetical protein
MIEFEYTNITGEERALEDVQAIIVIVTSGKESLFAVLYCEKEDASVDIKLPSDFTGDEDHSLFASTDGKRVVNSSYLGSIAIS